MAYLVPEYALFPPVSKFTHVSSPLNRVLLSFKTHLEVSFPPRSSPGLHQSSLFSPAPLHWPLMALIVPFSQDKLRVPTYLPQITTFPQPASKQKQYLYVLGA